MSEKQKNKSMQVICFSALWLAFSSVWFSSLSIASDLEVLPTSRHQQYLTYGLFTDEQSTAAFRSEGKAWTAVGGFISLLELKDTPLNPQLVAHGLASAGMRINTRGDTLLTDTVDARAGLAIDLKFTDSLRASLTWTHQSGHISDNVPDKDLIGSNLGNEELSLRVIKDLDHSIRLGGSLRPFLGTEPTMQTFGADQFFEWFLNGEALTQHKFSPFFATGLEEYGLHEIDFSFHAQVGLAIGNHFDETKTSSMRVVFGYYAGVDPRLKYYQFKNLKSNFMYGGFMFDL